MRLYWAEEGHRLYPHNESVVKLREALLTGSGAHSREELEKLYLGKYFKCFNLIIVIEFIKYVVIDLLLTNGFSEFSFSLCQMKLKLIRQMLDYKPTSYSCIKTGELKTKISSMKPTIMGVRWRHVSHFQNHWNGIKPYLISCR